MIPLASVVTWVIFAKRKYNIWEHALANTYIAAQLNIMWIVLHLLNLAAAFFTQTDFSLNHTVFLVVFLIFFMYLYGSVFGFLMYPFFKSKFLLILSLCLMNMILSALYSYGFNVTSLVGAGL